MMYSIPQERLNELFAKVAESYGLYMPQNDTTGKSEFKLWEEGAVLSDNLNTRRSAKDFFFPQMENYVNFKVEGKNITVTPIPKTDSDFVVFGVRACDAESFGILDTVFLAEPVDGYYKARREHATIVVRACGRPAETCFCTAVGIDPVMPKKLKGTNRLPVGIEKGTLAIKSLDLTVEVGKMILTSKLKSTFSFINSIIDEIMTLKK